MKKMAVHSGIALLRQQVRSVKMVLMVAVTLVMPYLASSEPFGMWTNQELVSGELY